MRAVRVLVVRDAREHEQQQPRVQRVQRDAVEHARGLVLQVRADDLAVGRERGDLLEAQRAARAVAVGGHEEARGLLLHHEVDGLERVQQQLLVGLVAVLALAAAVLELGQRAGELGADAAGAEHARVAVQLAHALEHVEDGLGRGLELLPARAAVGVVQERDDLEKTNVFK